MTIYCAVCGKDLTEDIKNMALCEGCELLHDICSGYHSDEWPLCKDCCHDDMVQSIAYPQDEDYPLDDPVYPDDDNDLIAEW